MKKSTNKKRPLNDLSTRAELKNRFISLMRENARTRRIHKVFSDFCEMAAIVFSNRFDKTQYEEREARYMQIIGEYSKEEIYRFAEILGVFTLLCETGFADHLGVIFMELEMGDAVRGQFFTPYEISGLMARIVLGDSKSVIEQNGFITLMEPACGAGGVMVAAAEAVDSLGVNYQQCMHVTGQDIDALAVHMAYIQMTLFHIPAIILHGNTLSDETWGYWVTPSHVLGNWDYRLYKKLKQEEQGRAEVVADVPAEMPEDVDVDSKPNHGVSPDLITKEFNALVMKRAKQLNLF